jgi:hypothetical protein
MPREAVTGFHQPPHPRRSGLRSAPHLYSKEPGSRAACGERRGVSLVVRERGVHAGPRATGAKAQAVGRLPRAWKARSSTWRTGLWLRKVNQGGGWSRLIPEPGGPTSVARRKKWMLSNRNLQSANGTKSGLYYSRWHRLKFMDDSRRRATRQELLVCLPPD